DFDAGKLVAKDALHLGQQADFGPRHEAEGEGRPRRLGRALRRFLGCFRLHQRHACMVEKGFSGRGQLDAVSSAVDQLSADFLFEIADLPAQRRLRSVEFLLGGNGQTAGIGHGDEVAEMPQLHCNLPYLAGMGPAYKVFFWRTSAAYSKTALYARSARQAERVPVPNNMKVSACAEALERRCCCFCWWRELAEP